MFLTSGKGNAVFKVSARCWQMTECNPCNSLFANTNLCRKSSSVGSFSQQFDKNLGTLVEGNSTQGTWTGMEGEYSLPWTHKNDTAENCNISKLDLEITSGNIDQLTDCTDTPWGCQIPAVWNHPQTGQWECFQPVQGCLGWEGSPGLPQDPLQVGIKYPDLTRSRPKDPRTKEKWDCPGTDT